MPRRIKIAAPATVANLVCGFDILGLALEDPVDIMELEIGGEPGLRIIHTDGFDLPVEPERNVAGAALLALMEELPEMPGFTLTVDKRIKPGSGLGSSAASSAGAVVAANM
jgi:homoserine kinase